MRTASPTAHSRHVETSNGTPTDRRMRASSAFVPAVIALLVVFATVGATIPMFNLYRAEEGFTTADISLAVVTYSAATLGTLLVFGRLSHHVGRRPVSIASLVLVALGTVVLLDVHNLAILIIGRVLMGLGAGLASSSLPPFIIDSAPAKPSWLASVASSQSVMFGLAIGGVASGALIQYAPLPRELIFLIMIGALIVSAVLVLATPETAMPTPGAGKSMRPQASLPPHTRHLAMVAAAVLLATWAIGAFYQAFVPTIVQGQLHTKSPLITGLIFAMYMVPSAIGAPLSGRWAPALAQRVGMVSFFVGMLGVITAVFTSNLPLFIGATALAGIGQGIAISATTRALLHGSTLAHRAPIFSVIYLLSYSGATIPSLIAGSLTHTFTLPEIVLGYVAFAFLGTVITVIAARNPRD
jgi:MFS family permease